MSSATPRWKPVAKRVAQYSFLFFLLKGLAWLAVGWLVWKGIR